MPMWSYMAATAVDQQKRTMFASQAFSLAELFKIAVGNKPLDGPVAYVPELSAPEGESTGGGKQAVQHVKLVAGGDAIPLVVGSANTFDKTAELRSYAFLVEVHQRRFKGSDLPVDRVAYDKFLDEVHRFFRDREFQVSRVDSPSQSPTAARAAKPSMASNAVSTGLAVVLMGVAAVGLSVALMMRR